MPIRVVLERGPKDKKVVAFAVDWSGWSRGAKTANEALDTLAAYRARYRPIAVRAGFERAFDRSGRLTVVEDRVGTGSTDFWGISFSPSSFESDPMRTAEFKRKLALLEACWAYFDDVAARVSPELRKGPRGGGRDRDKMVGHVNEADWYYARELGLKLRQPDPTDRDAMAAMRAGMLAILREPSDGSPLAGRKWTQRYAARRIAWHALDHSWEMEDRSEPG